jgi:hypothetical protein
MLAGKKRRVWAYCLLFIVTVIVTSCTSNSPRIVVEPPSQELGERPQQLIELIYTVRNQGNGSLKIGEISTTCGCTKASVDQATIPPNGETMLRVTMDAVKGNLNGDLFRMITLETNDPVTPKAQVKFHAKIARSGG